MFVPYNTEKIRLIKKNKKVILLMITDCKKCHYLALKRMSALFIGATTNHNGDICCSNCFHSCRTEKKL